MPAFSVVTWFMAIPEEGTYEEMKRKILALPWSYVIVQLPPPAPAEIWSRLFCRPNWKPGAWNGRTFEQMRQSLRLKRLAVCSECKHPEA